MDQALIDDIRRKKIAGRQRLVLGFLAVLGLAAAVWIAAAVRVFDVVIKVPVEGFTSKVEVISGIAFVTSDRVVTISEDVALLVRTEFFEDVTFVIDANTQNILEAELVPWTRQISVETDVADSFDWFVGERFVGGSDKLEVTVKPGTLKVSAHFGDLEVASQNIEVSYRSPREISSRIKLAANRLAVTSQPSGAVITKSGDYLGLTPFVGYLKEHVVSIVLNKDGFQTYRADDFNLLGGTNQINATLRRSTRELEVSLSPSGGQLSGGELSSDGRSVKVPLGAALKLTYSKKGYVPQTKAVSPSQASVAFRLSPSVGQLRVLEPVGATLKINSRDYGVIPVETTLETGDVSLVISRSGYITKSEQVSVYLDQVTDFATELETERDFLFRTLPAEVTVNGINLTRINGGQIKLGAPRSERGQRANELEYLVDLTRPYYIGKTEISVQQYRAVMGGGKSNDKSPITGVTWQQAARFCNRLSELEGVKPFYLEVNGMIRGFDSASRGYRLPTEAEWEFVARKLGRRQQTRFVWGDDYELPETGFGNIAVSEANGVAKRFIADRKDGYAELAPIGSFPGQNGIADLSGNVSEWVHDAYSIDTSLAGRTLQDHMGPKLGRQRFIKGSNYLSSSWTELRSSYREPVDGARSEVGFRIAKYLY